MNCGNPVKRNTGNVWYCSDKCHHDFMRARDKEGYRLAKLGKKLPPIMAICPVCGERFGLRAVNQLYCSPSCGSEVRKKSKEKAEGPAWSTTERTCRWCEKKFFPKSKNNAFCSDECKNRDPEKKAPKKIDWAAIQRICLRHHVSYGEAVQRGLIDEE